MDTAMFPGQGAQKVGMGGRLFDETEEFVSVEKQVDEILGYSVRQLCLEGPMNKLSETQFTQPCLYVVNALHYYNAVSTGWRPQVAVGHSLGEYNALHAAGVFDFLTGLRLVKKRGELMGQARNGGMAAVLGLTAERVAEVLRDGGLDDLDVANINSRAQTVVSGPTDSIARAGAQFENAGAKMYIPLSVSAAFHSRYMRPAAVEFASFLSGFSFRSPEIPVVSNVTARPYKVNDPAAGVAELLVEQIASSVRWLDTVRYLVGRGGGAAVFREIGPGEVLTRLVDQITKR